MTDRQLVKTLGVKLGPRGHVSTEDGKVKRGGWVEGCGDIFWSVSRLDKRGSVGSRVVAVTHLSGSGVVNGYAMGTYNATTSQWITGRVVFSVAAYVSWIIDRLSTTKGRRRMTKRKEKKRPTLKESRAATELIYLIWSYNRTVLLGKGGIEKIPWFGSKATGWKEEAGGRCFFFAVRWSDKRKMSACIMSVIRNARGQKRTAYAVGLCDTGRDTWIVGQLANTIVEASVMVLEYIARGKKMRGKTVTVAQAEAIRRAVDKRALPVSITRNYGAD